MTTPTINQIDETTNSTTATTFDGLINSTISTIFVVLFQFPHKSLKNRQLIDVSRVVKCSMYLYTYRFLRQCCHSNWYIHSTYFTRCGMVLVIFLLSLSVPLKKCEIPLSMHVLWLTDWLNDSKNQKLKRNAVLFARLSLFSLRQEYLYLFTSILSSLHAWLPARLLTHKIKDVFVSFSPSNCRIH